MSGHVLRIIHPTRYDFSSLAPDPGTTMSILIAQRIDATEFESATFQLRMHDVNFGSSDDLITVTLAPDGFTNDDTDTDFTAPTALVPTVQFAITQFTSVSDFVLGDVFGLSSLYLGYVTATRGGQQPHQTALSARFSLDLVVKTGDWVT